MKRRVIILAGIIVVVVAAAYRLLYPPPPDLTGEGYVSASFDFREYDETKPAFQVSTSDPAVVQALTRVLATGRNTTHCRCINLGAVTLTMPDGGRFEFRIMPAHGSDDCQILVGTSHRYVVNRAEFLRAVAPLGIPATRWTGPDD